MRLPLWMTTLLGALPILAGGTGAIAQDHWPQGAGQPGGFHAAPPGMPLSYDPPATHYPGYPYPPETYPTNTPVAVQEGHATMPPGASPWPQISPYDNAFDQHYHKDGLWHRHVSNEFRRYVTVDGLVVYYRKPSGAPIGTDAFDAQIYFVPVAQTAGFFPARLANLRTVLDKTSDESAGFRVRLGSINPDGSGLEFGGWWGGELPRRILLQHPNYNIDDVTTFLPLNPGLPLDTGFRPRPPGSGALPPVASDANTFYDKSVAISYSTEAWGTNLTWFSSRAWDTSALKLRPSAGIRYMGLREHFSFVGEGTGMQYFVTFPPGTPTSLIGRNTPEFRGSFDSASRSHLLGPEIGFRLDVGGDRFKIINETKVGVAGVYEHTTIGGRGLGSSLNPNYNPDRVFGDSQHHGRVAPMFEETITLEANLLGFVPVVKKVALFDRARFRVGYTFLWLGEIQRPHAIQYLAPELGNPQIDFSRRTDWYMQSLNFGVSWTY